jgi:GTP-binding protein Era
MASQPKYRSGFVAIIGRPNVGKSTLMNKIIGQKIAIMSDKAQTTRNKIQGVYTTDHAQIIFLDTPGIHKPKNKLGERMSDVAQQSLREVDLVLLVVDAAEGLGGGDRFIIEQLQAVNTPVFLVLNKVDRIAKDTLFAKISEYQAIRDFAEFIPISAIQGDNVDRLLEQIITRLPEGFPYYPADQVTDHPEQFICAELVREKILHLTQEEIPHSIAVQIEEMRTEKNGTVYVSAVIFVERDSQKGIVIGKQGAMLKQVATLARKDMEALMGSKIFLELWVKVKKDWRNSDQVLRNLGYFQE